MMVNLGLIIVFCLKRKLYNFFFCFYLFLDEYIFEDLGIVSQEDDLIFFGENLFQFVFEVKFGLKILNCYDWQFRVFKDEINILISNYFVYN